MAMTITGKDVERRIAGEGEAVYYARIPERLIDADGERVNMAATIDDPRNWRGSRGQKLQAVLRCLLRQWNAKANGTTTNRFKATGTIRLSVVKEETGINPSTARALLGELCRLRIIAAKVDNRGTRTATYDAELSLQVTDWDLPHIHTWQEPKPKKGTPIAIPF